MFVEKVLNNNIEYLRLCESVYTPGVKGGRKRVLLNIGPLDKVTDGKPDFYDRLRLSVKQGKPILKCLEPYMNIKKDDVKEYYELKIKKGDPILIGHPKLYSHILIERILEELGLIKFFSQYRSTNNISYDLVGFFRLLVYGRILNPTSKIQTVSQNNDYFNEILSNPYEYNIYDTLDFMYKYKNNIINKMHKSLVSSFNRTTSCIYYDCTNFFFETEMPDDDTYNDGNIVDKGIRKFGVSKEERHLPIVQMGMFIDEQGIPISIDVFPGNTLDHLTVPKSLSSVNELIYDKYIFVGDRGMYRGNNSAYLVNTNHGYIVSKSIEKTAKEERDWIFEQSDYIVESENFKYKSRNFKRKVKIDSQNTQEIVEKVVVYWSKQFAEKQEAENRSFLEFIEKLNNNPDNFRISKTQSNKMKKYLKSEYENTDTGEIIDASKLKTMIDMNKIEKFKRTFGYYQIVTSELNIPDKEIIDKYHGLSRIEDQFRIMKGTIDTRPMYVWTKEHITAHLLLCMISLTVFRLIQNKIISYKGIDTKKNWQQGMSAERLQKALRDWTVDLYTDGLYRFNNVDTGDLKTILNAYNIKIEPKLYTKKQLKDIKQTIDIFK